MGLFRLLLAFCVLYSHVFGPVAGWNIGVVAVISFFVMSGYVMTLLIAKHYQGIEAIPSFYLDRTARLFPQYLLYLAITLVAVGLLPITDNFVQDRSPSAVLLNALMLPAGFYMFFLERALYIPPAWSLGLELSFYLVFPFYLLGNLKARTVAVLGSVAVFALAVSGYINSDWFGYRLLPGTFFVFIAGACLARPSILSGRYPVAVVLGSLFVFCALAAFRADWFALPYNKEVLFGTMIGVSAVAALRNTKFSATDELFGSLSYGVFLNHFVIMWVLDVAHVSRLAVPAVSVAVAFASYKFVEEPALKLRQRLRASRLSARTA
ncbi:acyltransferase [Bosea sp. SSUT16]|uniref:Acyltransferase n=1 Tax=Bosea spartocytisi TaxID=2773451 RepID=A0A927HXJ6_9HYPH|nr:acyltransferase [Bosea spartocytisi]MBD3844274.1 acyltransferase [Bosea spartocytisi]MCT4470620.1 acyltransferase [Bosea spartocytisi]